MQIYLCPECQTLRLAPGNGSRPLPSPLLVEPCGGGSWGVGMWTSEPCNAREEHYRDGVGESSLLVLSAGPFRSGHTAAYRKSIFQALDPISSAFGIKGMTVP